jgi:AraC-like DNA-binding protein/mannose-6-phosphate isomerase-like protein (cupin superfamily)
MVDLAWFEPILREMRIYGVTAWRHICGPDWVIPERVSADDMFLYIIQGYGRMMVEDRRYVLRPGHCVHFRRQVPHRMSHDPSRPFVVVTLHYTATVLESLTLPELIGFPDYFNIREDPWLGQQFQEVLDEEIRKPVGYERGVEALVMRILLHLIRTKRYRATMRPQRAHVRHDDLLRLRPALLRMRSKLAQPDSLTKLARQVGLSPAQFRRIFVRALRTTPVQYQRRLRMERASRLLRTSTLTVEAIAGEVGYAEPAFFAKTFKRLMGLSPGKFRDRKSF